MDYLQKYMLYRGPHFGCRAFYPPTYKNDAGRLLARRSQGACQRAGNESHSMLLKIQPKKCQRCSAVCPRVSTLTFSSNPRRECLGELLHHELRLLPESCIPREPSHFGAKTTSCLLRLQTIGTTECLRPRSKSRETAIDQC